MAENNPFGFADGELNYYEDIRLKVEQKRMEKSKWIIPVHLKLALEQSIKKGNELIYGSARIK